MRATGDALLMEDTSGKGLTPEQAKKHTRDEAIRPPEPTRPLSFRESARVLFFAIEPLKPRARVAVELLEKVHRGLREAKLWAAENKFTEEGTNERLFAVLA